jgi:hypothetical protein
MEHFTFKIQNLDQEKKKTVVPLHVLVPFSHLGASSMQMNDKQTNLKGKLTF